MDVSHYVFLTNVYQRVTAWAGYLKHVQALAIPSAVCCLSPLRMASQPGTLKKKSIAFTKITIFAQREDSYYTPKKSAEIQILVG